MSFNKIIIVGNLGKDPELRYTPQGTAVCSFSMATTEKRGDNESTCWFRVTVWDKKAEVAAKYLEKGKQVYIEGRLRLDEWTDRDGNVRQTLDVSATDMQFIGNRVDSEYTEPYGVGGADSDTRGEPITIKSAGLAATAANDAVKFPKPMQDRTGAEDDGIPF